MYHLVVLKGVGALVERFGLLLCVRDDVSEEGQPVVSLADPAWLGHGAHVVLATGARGTEHHQNYVHS